MSFKSLNISVLAFIKRSERAVVYFENSRPWQRYALSSLFSVAVSLGVAVFVNQSVFPVSTTTSNDSSSAEEIVIVKQAKPSTPSIRDSHSKGMIRDQSLYFFFPKAVPEPSELVLQMKVSARILNVRSEPGTTASVVGTLREGELLTVVVINPEWAELEDGGYVSLEFLEMTNPS